MSGDHLNKLNSMSTGVLNAQSNVNLASSMNAVSLQASSSAGYGSASNCHNPVKLVHTLSPLNQRYVKLNIGGRLFSTSIDTLTKQDNMLRAMFSGRIDVSTDSDGYIVIDRCGRHFEFILNYLRDEDVQGVAYYLDDKSDVDLYDLLKEAKFYCIQPLINLVEQKILSNKSNNVEPYLGSSVVSMITSKSDLIKILTSSEKPCIRLLINRHNNKYSYTSYSDDNLLKNIELFERMAIKFKNRILFIKDTTSTEEICCWYFHGAGRKLAEVCCTSIVYTTEKKQTKVEFPDSKILEEIFVNAVLFESKETNTSNNENHGLIADDDTDNASNNNGNTQQCLASTISNGATNYNSSNNFGSANQNSAISTASVSSSTLSSATNLNQIGVNGSNASNGSSRRNMR